MIIMNSKLQLATPKIKHSIYLILVCLTTILSVACQSKKTTANQSDVLNSTIGDYLKQSEANGFSGAVLVVKNDSIIINKGFGLANKENNVLNNANAVYDICSVTKQFTAAAILKLVEENKLKLEDPISKFFDNLPEDKKILPYISC